MLKEEVREFIKQRVAGFEDWQRAVMYCQTRDQCTSLADMLQCGCFYSQHEGNEKALEGWIKGDHKVIVATGALGMGVDIQGITLVVHFREPYTLIDFSQESGRGGRRQGETVESVVFTSPANSGIIHPDSMVQQYIEASKCRREVLSGYLDGAAVDCSTSGGLLCDLCQDRQLIAAEGGIVVDAAASPVMLHPGREDGNYTQARQASQLGSAQSLDLEQYICRCIDAFKKVCAGCVVFHGGSVHKPKECELVITNRGSQQKERLYTYIKELKDGIQYEPNTCCYKCSVPCDFCATYCSNKGKDKSKGEVWEPCRDQNSVVCLAACLFLEPDKLEQYSGQRFNTMSDYQKWLVEPLTVLGKRSHNAFKLFCDVVEDKKDLISSRMRGL
jgi:hypothetical protein